MTRKSEELSSSGARGGEPTAEGAGPSPASEPAPPAAPAPPAPPAPPATEAVSGGERDFDNTLKNNDNPDKTETVVARGIDGGLAAQAAMRVHPGWTADHSKTQEHTAG
jgi:hypothetical protein